MKTNNIKSIAVYCGSSIGNKTQYAETAKELAKLMAAENIALIYGGAKVGIMGIMADEMLKHGGTVIGVIPKLLVDKEIAHVGVTDIHIVESMHERKARMADLSDGFIMLPGGPGSLDEFFEIFTWAKLGYHTKPFGILNVEQYYDLMIQFIDHSVSQGFLHQEHRDMIQVDACPNTLLQKFKEYCPDNITHQYSKKSEPA